jgi:hypothetical protein
LPERALPHHLPGRLRLRRRLPGRHGGHPEL